MNVYLFLGLLAWLQTVTLFLKIYNKVDGLEDYKNKYE
jgi:hypothetical protein